MNSSSVSHCDTLESEIGTAQLPGSSMEQNTDGFSREEIEEATVTLEALTEADVSSLLGAV